MESLPDKFRRIPPPAVRMCAFTIEHEGNAHRAKPKPVPLPLDKVVSKSGLTKRTFQRMAYAKSWDSFRFFDVFAFCAACGVNMESANPLWRLEDAIAKYGTGFLKSSQRVGLKNAMARMKGLK